MLNLQFQLSLSAQNFYSLVCLAVKCLLFTTGMPLALQLKLRLFGKGHGSWFCVGFFPEIQIILKSG